MGVVRLIRALAMDDEMICPWDLGECDALLPWAINEINNSVHAPPLNKPPFEWWRYAHRGKQPDKP